MANGSLRIVLGDQLSTRLAVIAEADKAADTILMAEVMTEATYVRHHVKKIAFLFAAMRHYAEALRQAGFRVCYVTLDDPDNSHSLEGEILSKRPPFSISCQSSAPQQAGQASRGG